MSNQLPFAGRVAKSQATAMASSASSLFTILQPNDPEFALELLSSVFLLVKQVDAICDAHPEMFEENGFSIINEDADNSEEEGEEEAQEAFKNVKIMHKKRDRNTVEKMKREKRLAKAKKESGKAPQ